MKRSEKGIRVLETQQERDLRPGDAGGFEVVFGKMLARLIQHALKTPAFLLDSSSTAARPKYLISQELQF
jgi:hypothetical protein